MKQSVPHLLSSLGVGREEGLPQTICVSIDKHYCTAQSVLQFIVIKQHEDNEGHVDSLKSESVNPEDCALKLYIV